MNKAYFFPGKNLFKPHLIKIKISDFNSVISWDFLKNIDRKGHVTFCFQNGTVNGDTMPPLTIKLNYSKYKDA